MAGSEYLEPANLAAQVASFPLRTLQTPLMSGGGAGLPGFPNTGASESDGPA
jgi:hypothetical protein